MACITVIAPILEVSYEIDVTLDMLVRDLKVELEVLTGLPIGKQYLASPSSQVFKNDRTLGSYGIEEIQRDPFFLLFDTVQVFVKTLTGKTRTLELSLDATILSLKHELEMAEGIPADRQRLVFAGRQLQDDLSLSQCGIKKESTVHMVLRLTGGGLPENLAFAGVCREWDGSMYCDIVTGLSLSYKQLVMITQKIDDHWFKGRLPGNKEEGVFPSTFVEVLEYSNENFMLADRGSAPFSPKNDDTQRTSWTSWWISWWTPVRKLRTPPEFAEEVSRASELMKQNEVLTRRPGLALPPFRYPMIRKPEFKFPLPKSSFIHLSVTCESANPPGNPVTLGVSLSSHAHDSIFVSSIHLTIEAGGSEVLDVRPVFETRSGKHIEIDVQSTSSTENTRQLSGKSGVAQMVTGEVGVTKEWKTGTSLQLGGKETIPAQVSGQVVGKSAFWNIQSEITPSRLRGFSGPVWNGMTFVLDRYSVKLEYRLTVNCRIQGEAKDRIIKGKWWWKGSK